MGESATGCWAEGSGLCGSRGLRVGWGWLDMRSGRHGTGLKAGQYMLSEFGARGGQWSVRRWGRFWGLRRWRVASDTRAFGRAGVGVEAGQDARVAGRSRAEARPLHLWPPQLGRGDWVG